MVVDASGLSCILARMSTKQLTRGARASFYRDGHDLVSACNIPEAGAFVVRDLHPGQYVVKDSCGGEQSFSIGVGQEAATILDGDVPGVTGAPGMSGSAEVSAHNVGVGGGVVTSPEQVAAEENVTGRVRRDEGEAPAERAAPVPAAEKPMQRPRDPGREQRVPGQAGAALVQDAPIRSVQDTVDEAARRARLEPDDRELEQLEAEEAAVPVPPRVAPAARGPKPEESTLPPEGYGASATATPTPLEGRREGDPQPPLGDLPEAA